MLKNSYLVRILEEKTPRFYQFKRKNEVFHYYEQGTTTFLFPENSAIIAARAILE